VLTVGGVPALASIARQAIYIEHEFIE
jgi:hypothetical protein